MSGVRRAIGVGALVCAAAGVSVPLENAIRPTELAEGVALVPLTLVLAYLWVRRRPVSPLGRPSAPAPRWTLLGAIAFAGPFVGTLLAIALTGVLVVPVPGVISTTIVFAALEELVFRGAPLMFLIAVLTRVARPPVAVVGVSILLAGIFAASHGATTVLSGIDRFAFALLATFLVLFQDRIRSAVVLHVTSNLYWFMVQPVVAAPVLLVGADLVLMLGCVAVMVAYGLRQAHRDPTADPSHDVAVRVDQPIA